MRGALILHSWTGLVRRPLLHLPEGGLLDLSSQEDASRQTRDMLEGLHLPGDEKERAGDGKVWGPEP